MAKMHAVVKTKPAPGAEWMEVDIPSLGPKDVLIKVKAAAICGTDVHVYRWTPWAQARIKPPIICGHEFSGEVVETGEDVTLVKVGDLVAGETHIPDGTCYTCRTGDQHICVTTKILGVHTDGAFAEYIVVPELIAWKLPEGFSPEIGAIMEPIGVAMHAVDVAGPMRGNRVVIFGDGPIGIFATALARASGATMVITVGHNDYRLDLARKMGATHTINSRKEDPVPIIKDLTADRGGIDSVIELSGSHEAIKQGFEVLRKSGYYVQAGFVATPVTLDMSHIIFKEARVTGISGRVMFDTWYQVQDVLDRGVLDPTPVITHRFPLREFDKGFETVMSRQAGKVILLPE